MRNLYLVLFFLFIACDQPDTPASVIEKSIAYHDPDSNWDKFQDSLNIRLSMPSSEDRISKVYIDRPNSHFALRMLQDSISRSYYLDKENCWLLLNDKSNFSEDEAAKNDLNCERAKMYRNYYEYLYGLPMKLRDEGANLESLETVKFKGRDYLKLKVTYDEKVGNDIWCFYFDQETYALKAYQFYKKDEKGGLDENSGEYIILEDLEVIAGIKMPKIRTWFYNSNDELLGTDILE